MGMFDTVWAKKRSGEEVDLQFKCGSNTLQNYHVGDDIPIDDGIYYCFDGCFVVFKGKVVAAFVENEFVALNKWGQNIEYPDLG